MKITYAMEVDVSHVKRGGIVSELQLFRFKPVLIPIIAPHSRL